MSGIKRLALKVLTHPTVLRGVERTSRGTAAVLTLHRFRAFGRPGHDLTRLARNLAWLRRRRYNLVPLSALVERLREGAPLPRQTVAFTVDDGYACFAEVAASIFAAFDCPVTVFLITGFLDGDRWMWWDRVRYAIDGSPRRDVPVAELDGLGTLRWASPADRHTAARRVIARFKELPTADRERWQTELETRLEVALPDSPPDEIRPMTWHEVRRLATSGGVAFGPHTVTHPILSRSDPEGSRREVQESWARLQAELRAPLPVFCWPNGDRESFGAREEGFAREAGLIAAVSTMQDSVTPASWRTGPYALPRYAYQENETDFAQVVSGLERLKVGTRRLVAAIPPG